MESTCQIVFGYTICIYLIHYNVIALVVTFFGLTVVTIYMTKFIIKFEIAYMMAKDRRVQLLRNVLKNIKYIKLKVWELFYHAKLFQRKEAELTALKKSNFVFSIIFFLNWINPTSALAVSVLSMILFSGESVFQAAKILAFMKILVTILRGMTTIPESLKFLVELRVSLGRLNAFLDADELNTEFIEKSQNQNAPFALELEFGNFFWNKMDEKAMKEKKDKAQKEKRERRGKLKKVQKAILDNNELLIDRSVRANSVVSDIQSQQGSISGSVLGGQSIASTSRLKQRTLVGSLREAGGENKMAFQLKELEISIPKGQLTMIFGEIGQGKSSLFYALLGEMSQKFEEPKPKLRINGSVGFMSQKPWIMAKTVKENIVMDLPFDQARFDHAVKYSALDDDLKLFAEKENRVLSAGGENVSGGQRTRIEFARMIYQK